MMVKAASSELEEERNKLNWRITDKDKNKSLPSSREWNKSIQWKMFV
jgi:hypothetical protein